MQQATYLGETMDYRVQVNEELELRVQASGTRRVALGARVQLFLPPERVRLIGEE
ncbi:MAG: TOBE domain-containing protein [Ignavibacteriales bacterium]|nr:TOBE domain-containing protein [Ignavibacteriales bacterium]